MLAATAAADARVLAEPAPMIAVSALADSSVNFTMRLWTATENYWPLYFDMLEAVKNRFDKAGITIPFPQQDLHLFPVPGAQTPAGDGS